MNYYPVTDGQTEMLMVLKKSYFTVIIQNNEDYPICGSSIKVEFKGIPRVSG